MLDISVVKQLHPDGVTRSDIGDLSLGSVTERAQIAPEIVIVGSQVVKSVGELGRHVVLRTRSLTNVLPVFGNFVVQHELAEDVVRRSGMGQHSGHSEKICKILHLE